VNVEAVMNDGSSFDGKVDNTQRKRGSKTLKLKEENKEINVGNVQKSDAGKMGELSGEGQTHRALWSKVKSLNLFLNS
jgi:hypothetical protein